MNWPVEAFRHRYVTPFGGLSTDLYPWQVGVNAEALRRNTSLAPGAHILVSADLGGQPRPLFAKAFYEVVALDPAFAPQAANLSQRGEAVFSAFEEDGDARGQSVLRDLASSEAARGVRATVVLNAALAGRGPTF